MSSTHSTGPAGARSNVYRLDNTPAVLRSRKPRNRFRLWMEKFCALPPASRLRVMKTLLAESEAETEAASDPAPARSSRLTAAFLLSNGISLDLWKRYQRAQDEAFRLEWQERAP